MSIRINYYDGLVAKEQNQRKKANNTYQMPQIESARSVVGKNFAYINLKSSIDKKIQGMSQK